MVLQLKTTPVLFYDRGDVVFWSGEENQSVTDRALGVSLFKSLISFFYIRSIKSIKYIVMNKYYFFRFTLLVFGCVALFSSCKKDDPTTITEPDTPVLENRIIKASVVLDNVWTEEEPTKDGEQNSSVFMCYLFDPNNNFLRRRGGNVSDNMVVQFEDATATGVHSMYAITGWQSVPNISSIDLNNTQLPLFPSRDITLGCTTFTIVAGTMDYNVQVATSHIMAKLALAIRYVPSHITSITVSLPNQGNTFKFDGTIEGNTQAQTLTLTKGTTPNENGSFNWTLPETIVLPCETGTTSMPINIVISSSLNSPRTILTSTSICCTSGTRKSLWAEWDGFYNETTVTVNPWTEDVETGQFYF